ncbi:DUF4294 domain-containing protein [Lutibacter holmesii]|uniref:DUF4294 domain-containing protein n=1 Tax=Lutibacter holmesii TaxID=1137985 RepID=A0ABW3WK37_9FLAO
MKSFSKISIVLFVFLNSCFVFSQEEIKDSIPITERYIIFEGDTLLIELDEVLLLKKLKFETSYNRRYYFWFRKKVLKAYPYAKIASERLDTLNVRLEGIRSKHKKKKYTKQVQKYMEEEFTEQLKKLTRTEGRVLIKLLHRQTGIVTFDLVKDYRSGWKAFWYNTTAHMFNLSLKDGYSPVDNAEDFLIEDILQRAFVEGILDEQPSKLPIDYMELSTKELKFPLPKPKKH